MTMIDAGGVCDAVVEYIETARAIVKETQLPASAKCILAVARMLQRESIADDDLAQRNEGEEP